MNIKTPFELIGLPIKGIKNKLKENNISFKDNKYNIELIQNIEQLNIEAKIRINYSLKKVHSVSFEHNYKDLKHKTNAIDNIKEIIQIYKQNFEITDIFDPKDNKMFYYSFKHSGHGIYVHGTGVCSNEQYISIYYFKESKIIEEKENKENQKEFYETKLQEEDINKLNELIDIQTKSWYGITSKYDGKKMVYFPSRLDVNDDNITIYKSIKNKINKIEIPYNQMTDYGIYNELLSIYYDKYDMLLFTVVKNDINELNNIISSILGYNSQYYLLLNKTIEDAFISYNPFNTNAILDSRNKLYIKELTKKIFREQKINKDNIYKILNGIDFDISFYIEWENFASYLFNRIKEQNLLKE